MALIPRPTGFLENPLNQTLFGNNKEIAIAGTTDSIETNTNQINLLPGSLATGIAVTDNLEITSPAKIKFQTDAVIQVGAGNNLVVDGIPVAGVAPTNVLYYNTANQRVTYGTAPSSGSAWSTIPAGANVNMNGNSLINANILYFSGLALTDMQTGNYTATVSTQIDLSADANTFITSIPGKLTITAANVGINDEIYFNGPVALANGMPLGSFLVAYNPSGTEYSLSFNYTASSVSSINNISGPRFSVFAQSAPNTTVAVPAVVGETYLAVDSQNRIQWLTQNTQTMNPDDMFPENTQEAIAIRPTLSSYFRSTVLGLDGLVYCLPGGTAPRTASTIDPTNNIVTNNIFDITASNAFPRYSICAPNGKIYMIPLSAVNGANPFFFPIYDTITKTLDISVPAPWINGAGAITGALDATGRFIWMPPQAETAGAGQRIRRFDTVTNTTIETGTTYPAVTFRQNRWGSAVLTPDGNIVCFPFNARLGTSPPISQVLKIDTTTGNGTLIPLTGVTSGDTMYYAACLSPDGNFVYVSPQSATNVLKWNWRTDTFTQPAGLAVGAFGGTKYSGIVAAPNGLIYMFPWDLTTIQVIDPATDTFVASIPVPNNAVLAKYADPVLAPNGKIYSAPHSANNAGNLIASVVKTGIPTIPAWMLGPGINAQ